MTQEFVTLPREVVEQALEAMSLALSDVYWRKGNPTQPVIHKAYNATRSALKQPQNHVPDAGNMVTAGWKLVPVESTRGMIEAGEDAHYEAEKRSKEPDAWEQGGFAKRAVRAAHVFQAMLAAAPQPLTTEKSSVVHPQANQPAMTPIAQRKLEDLMASGYTISGYSVYHEQKHQHGFVTGAGLVGWWKPEGVEYPQPRGEQEPVAFAIFTEAGNARMWSTFQPHVQELADAEGLTVTPLYTHPQPKREPLTNEQVKAGLIHLIEYTDARERCAFNIGVRFAERAHNIK